MNLWIYDHAVKRFQERVRPGLHFVAAAEELRRLVREYGERVDRPSWAPVPHGGRYYVRITEDVLLVCEPAPEPRMLPRCVSVIARGCLAPEERSKRNRKRKRHHAKLSDKLQDGRRPPRSAPLE